MMRCAVISGVDFFVLLSTCFFCPHFICPAFSDAINAKGCGLARTDQNPSPDKHFERPLQPWIVYIVARIDLQDNVPYGTFSCAGSIISPSFVLTAAHCLTNGICTPTVVNVFYNTTIAERGPYVSANHVFYHPDLNKNVWTNDVALLRLSEPLRFDGYVKPVCLLEKSMSLNNKELAAPNWGYQGDKKGPKTLQYATSQVIPHNECTKRFKIATVRKDVWTRTLLCTQAQGKNIQQGESGGPLTLVAGKKPAVQVGISSFTFCTKNERPSAHTNVVSYIPWIKKVLDLCTKWGRRKTSH